MCLHHSSNPRTCSSIRRRAISRSISWRVPCFLPVALPERWRSHTIVCVSDLPPLQGRHSSARLKTRRLEANQKHAGAVDLPARLRRPMDSRRNKNPSRWRAHV